MGFFSKKEKQGKLNSRYVYTLQETLAFAKDPKYAHYDFEQVNPDDIKAGFRAISREIVQESISKINAKRNRRTESFENIVVAGGKYKGIDKMVNLEEYVKTRNMREDREIG